MMHRGAKIISNSSCRLIWIEVITTWMRKGFCAGGKFACGRSEEGKPRVGITRKGVKNKTILWLYKSVPCWQSFVILYHQCFTISMTLRCVDLGIQNSPDSMLHYRVLVTILQKEKQAEKCWNSERSWSNSSMSSRSETLSLRGEKIR